MLQSKITVAELMDTSGVAFGTSGARGLVTAMTDKVCYGYVRGFLQYMIEDSAWETGGRVALAGDLRPSTPRILRACAQSILDLGGQPIFCGYVPTPAMAHWAFAEGIPSIMVTGSHIPEDRNGIKFYRPAGEILKQDEPGITRQTVTFGDNAWSDDGMLLSPPSLPAPADAAATYLARYLDAFGSDALLGMKIGVYQHSAVGRDLIAEILSVLGAEVLPLGRSEIFVPVDTEAVRAEDIELARKWASEHELDAIVSTDGDSDRPLLADDEGEWLRGDVLGVLCARALGVDSVATPVSSNTLVEKCGDFSRVHRTQIGSPYVIAAMDAALLAAEGVVCGYEANGGFLLASDAECNGKVLRALPTRDAVLPVVAVLSAARPGRLRDLLAKLPPRVTFSDRLQDFAPDRRDALMSWLQGEDDRSRDALLEAEFAPIAEAALTGVNLVDGVRLSFANDRIIHLRGSGNAPELRCYAEAETADAAAAINQQALRIVAQRFP